MLANSSRSNRRVIFVHPTQDLMYRIILPFSVPALIKRIPTPTYGCYAFELSNKDLHKVDVILMDINWYYQVSEAVKLARHIKEINPKCTIVAGGITASLYAKVLVNQFDFDYVIRGDAEIPLPSLVMALVEGDKDLSNIPNLVGKGNFETPWTYTLRQQDFEENDFFYFDFFPSFKKDLERFHASKPGWPIGVHPYIITFRGCPIDCNYCVGSITEQKKIFRRTAVIRSACKVAEDLERINSDPYYQFVNGYFDFVTLLPESYSQEVLRKPTKLAIHYELTGLPSMNGLELLLSSFKGGLILFSIDSMHNSSIEPIEPSLLIPLIKKVQNTAGYTAVLCYVSLFAKENRNYREAVREVLKQTRCYLYDVAIWWEDFPKPDENGDADPATLHSYLHLSWKQRFLGLKFWGRVGMFTDRLFPKSWSVWLARVIYRLFHNLPFKLKFGWK